MATIKVNGHELDAASQQEGGKFFVSDASTSNFILLQCQSILQATHYNKLEELSCDVLEYINPNTYLCRYPPADLERLRSLPFVIYANVYHNDLAQRPGFAASLAVSQIARTTDGAHDGDNTLTRSAVAPPGIQLHNVYIGLHDDSGDSIAKVKQALVEKLGVDIRTVVEDGHRLQMTLKAEDIPAVTSLDDVKYVEKVPFRQFFNDNAREILRFPPHAGKNINESAFDADGETIAIADTGLDNGKLDGIHPAFNKGRVTLLKDYTRGTDAENFTDIDGHGTHVCASAVGDGTSTYHNGVELVQFKVQGTAPLAHLLFQKVDQKKLTWGYVGLDPSSNPRVAADKDRIDKLLAAGDLQPSAGNLVLSMNGLLMDGYNHEKKARIHNQSWGSIPIPKHQAPYDSTAYEIDKVISTYPDYLVVVAAGNANGAGGVSGPTIDSPGSAKNVLTVGNSHCSRRLALSTINHIELLTYHYAGDRYGNPDMVYVTSSQGPTTELRQKPDIVAPGLTIYSARPQPPAIAADNPNMAQDGESEDNLWWYATGTSMAAPLVSGCAAVVRKQLRSKIDVKTYSPSAALIKAILINSAIDISESLKRVDNKLLDEFYVPTGPIPDIAQGFGRLSMVKAVENINDTDSCGYFETGIGDKDIQPLLQNDPDSKSPVGTYSQKIIIKKFLTPKTPEGFELQALPVTSHVTMVYSDPPGLDLQNKLTLKVAGLDATGDVERVPNKTNKGVNAETDNNVQKVVWKGVLSDSVVINIKAVRVLGNKVVQHFALAWRAVYGPPPDTMGPQVLTFTDLYNVYSMKIAYQQWTNQLSEINKKALSTVN